MFTRSLEATDIGCKGFAVKIRIAQQPVPSEVKLRPRVRGKFIFLGNNKFYVRGVTYGTFRPDAEGNEFPDSERVANDFCQMAANGFNAVRTYTAPPRWLLAIAQSYGFRV